MSKKILFFNTSKLAVLSAVLLLAVFCTIGMSFRPVYSEDEAEIVISGPRHSHWTTEEDDGCGGKETHYHNKNDYGKTSAHTNGGGTVSAYGDNTTSSAKVGNPAVSGNNAGDSIIVTWNCHTTTKSGNGDNSGTDKNFVTDLEDYHTNNMVFVAHPSLGYRFLGWYADINYKIPLTTEDTIWEEPLIIPGKEGYPQDQQVNTYESSSTPWYEKKFYAKFEAISHQTISFLPPSTTLENKGDYDVTILNNKTTLTTNGLVESVYTAVTLEAHPVEGYGFYGWYSLDETTGERTIIATSNPCSMTFDEDLTIGALIKLRPRNYNITFKAVAQNESGTRMGSYTVKESEELSETVEAADYIHNTGSNYDFTTTLAATAADNYIFTGWYSLEGKKKVYHSTANPWNVTLEEEMAIYADFAFDGYDASTYAQFKVGNTPYSDLNAADAAASAGNHLIVCSANGILPPGAYTISAGNTLLIPCDDDNNYYMYTGKADDDFKNMRTYTYSPVSSYRELTLKPGANITVYGNIYVAGNHLASTQGLEDASGGAGRPVGQVGRIQMKEGGQITLENGSKLYAFGYITGQDRTEGNNRYDVGSIIANEGSQVYENFILGDMKGGTCTAALTVGDNAGVFRTFPFNSYFIQNIEIPLYINYGAEEWCVTSIATEYKGTPYYVSTIVPLVGKKKAMFLLQGEGATIGKWYDATTDHVLYELTGKSKLGNLTMQLSVMGMIDLNINSAAFVLPISNSMHLVLNDCNILLTNELCLLPGAILEIQNNSSLTTSTNIFLYDTQQWGAYCFSKYFRTYNTPFTSHLIRNGNDMSTIDDAQLIVDGQLTIASTGTLYSTASGANICGTGGGKLVYQNTALPDPKNVYQVVGSGTAETPYKTDYYFGGLILGVGAGNYIAYVTPIGMQAANLHNEDDTYTQSEAAKTFYNVNGRWFIDGKQNEKENHTYDFTYIPNTNTGDATLTPAVYSHDKTGLEERMKWANVTAYACNYNEVEYTDWWKGQGDQLTYFYNWTTESDWHQFIKTSTTIQDGDKAKDVYSGSNNKLYLYTQDECNWVELEEADENCLYTVEGVKKALVGTDFIALEPNATDAAYHNASNANEFYICFKGCNWHLATPYPDELKAYTIEAGGTYIWYDDDWLGVEREAPLFYTTDESNVRTYYTYKDGEWTLAQPVATVSDALETRSFYFMDQAMDVATKKQNATITLLQDVTVSAALVYNSTQNTTCTLDLNGCTLTGSVADMLTIDASGSKFVIDDNSTLKQGKINLVFSVNNARRRAIYIKNGELTLMNGIISSTNTLAYSNTNKYTYAEGIYVAADKKFTMKGGKIEVTSDYNPYGIEGAATSTITIEDGVINVTANEKDSPYGIISLGTIYFKGGELNATATKSSSSIGIHINTNTSAQGVLHMTKGTVNATAQTSSARGVYVNRSLAYNTSEPRGITNFYLGTANISGGEITATCKTSTEASGVLTYGTVNITGGTINAICSANTTAFGVRLFAGTTTISGNTTEINATSTSTAYGVRVSEEAPSAYGGPVYNGVLVVSGGTFNVNTTSGSNAYGVYVGNGSVKVTTTHASNSSYYAGNYANAGTATINSGCVFNVNAKTSNAYGVFVKGIVEQSGAEGYTKATATPVCTINGGKFKLSAANGTVYATNNAADPANFHVNGGYYSHNDNSYLDAYTASPKHVVTLPKTDVNYPDYKYEVANAYRVTFMNDETELQSGYQKQNTTAAYSGAEPTRGNTTEKSFIWDGWSLENNGDKVALASVTADATYYAHFEETTLKHRVTLDANGGNEEAQLIYVEPGEQVGALPSATKTGYTFQGWYSVSATTGGTKLETTTTINADVTYYARYSVNSHTLTWNLAGGKVKTAGTQAPVNAEGTPCGSVNYGASITAPVVEKTGYSFQNWGVAFVASSMPDNDLTYTASWTPNTNTAYKVIHKLQNPNNLEEYITDADATENLTGTTGAYVAPKPKTTYVGYITPDAVAPTQIAADESLEIVYKYDCITYTITYDATTNGGVLQSGAPASVTVVYNQTIPSLPTASKEAHIFDGWFTKAVGGDKITTSTPILYNIGTLYAQYSTDPLLEVENAQMINVTRNSDVENTIVHVGGRLTISSGKTLTTDNLILEASADASGEITGNVVAGNAYFDLHLNTESRHWHAFTVPFECNVSQHLILADGVEMPLGVQYDIVYYDGAERAANGKTSNCWRYVEDDADWTLVPGRAYMIVFGRNVNTVRFTKKDGASIAYAGTTTVAKNTSTTGNNADGGWNGVGNPTTYHALLDAGVTECQVHDGGPINGDGYNLYDLTGKLVVGKAVYVQVASPKSVDVVRAEATDPNIAAKAPRRNREEMNNERYDVQIAPADGEMADRMFLLVDEDKTDEYVILADLAKAGVSNRRAQMWVAKYNEKLCKHTAIPENGVAEYPLGIFVPDDGEYEIYISAQPDNDETLYLTYDGQAIWDLTMGAYRTTFGRGTTNHYGLRLVNKAPSVATGIEETTIENGETIRKVMIDNQVYIIRNGEVYTLTGQKVQ